MIEIGKVYTFITEDPDLSHCNGQKLRVIRLLDEEENPMSPIYNMYQCLFLEDDTKIDAYEYELQEVEDDG